MGMDRTSHINSGCMDSFNNRSAHLKIAQFLHRGAVPGAAIQGMWDPTLQNNRGTIHWWVHENNRPNTRHHVLGLPCTTHAVRCTVRGSQPTQGSSRVRDGAARAGRPALTLATLRVSIFNVVCNSKCCTRIGLVCHSSKYVHLALTKFLCNSRNGQAMLVTNRERETSCGTRASSFSLRNWTNAAPPRWNFDTSARTARFAYVDTHSNLTCAWLPNLVGQFMSTQTLTFDQAIFASFGTSGGGSHLNTDAVLPRSTRTEPPTLSERPLPLAFAGEPSAVPGCCGG